jgi:hypothetical protein
MLKYMEIKGGKVAFSTSDLSESSGFLLGFDSRIIEFNFYYKLKC